MAATGPTRFPKRAVVARTLPCEHCGYDLRGVRVEGRCPECGASVGDTVERVIDPEAPRIPRLRNPRVVGRALLMLVTLQLLAMLLIVAGPTVAVVSAWLADRPLSSMQLIPPGWAIAGSMVCAALGVIPAVVLIQPAREQRDRRVRLAVRCISLGHIIAAGVLAALYFIRQGWLDTSRGLMTESIEVERSLIGLVLIGAGLVISFGNSGVLRAIGERSRTYRESRGGRQGIRAMAVAWTSVALGIALVSIFGDAATGAAVFLGTAGRLLIIVSLLMIVIGQVYLVVNANWIRLGVLRQGGRITDLVRIEADSSIVQSSSHD